MNPKHHLIPVLVIISLTAGAAGFGQSVPPSPPPPPDDQLLSGPGAPLPPDKFSFVGFEMSLGGRQVKGAPYSAQTTSQTTQTLGDGNHINRTVTGQVYRDSQGRTRRENSLPAIGPWVAEGKAQPMIIIHDPVAGVDYVLSASQKTAFKMMPSSGAGHGQFGANRPWHDKADSQATMNGQGPASRTVVKESLGKQTIEGLEAEGTRVTITIPAGQIGNERPIVIVSERWYSPDLQMVILAKRNDPRMGESIYRVTKIVRSEPALSFFEVPADYTIKEGQPGEGPRRMGMRFGRQ